MSSQVAKCCAVNPCAATVSLVFGFSRFHVPMRIVALPATMCSFPVVIPLVDIPLKARCTARQAGRKMPEETSTESYLGKLGLFCLRFVWDMPCPMPVWGMDFTSSANIISKAAKHQAWWGVVVILILLLTLCGTRNSCQRCHRRLYCDPISVSFSRCQPSVKLILSPGFLCSCWAFTLCTCNAQK